MVILLYQKNVSLVEEKHSVHAHMAKLLYFITWFVDIHCCDCGLLSCRKSGNAQILLTGLLAEISYWRSAAILILRVRIIFLQSPFLEKLLCMCMSGVWMSLTSYRVKWNPQRKRNIFLGDTFLSFMFIRWQVLLIIYFCSMKSSRCFLLSQICSPVKQNQEPWMVKRGDSSRGSRYVIGTEEGIGKGSSYRRNRAWIWFHQILFHSKWF